MTRPLPPSVTTRIDKIKSELVDVLLRHQAANKLTQKQLADKIGVRHQSTVSSLLAKKHERKFTLDQLVIMLFRLGYDIEITIR